MNNAMYFQSPYPNTTAEMYIAFVKRKPNIKIISVITLEPNKILVTYEED